MNSENRGKLRKIITRMRTSKVTNTPQSMDPLFGVGIMAAGLDRVSKLMQEYSNSNRIEGMSDPDAYVKAMTAANIGMKLGGLGGASLMQKFVNDHYQYAVHPAIRSIGQAGGKYGRILENYIQAKSDIKKSYGDMGAQIGQGLAFGLGLFAKGLRLGSIGAAATGIGIPAAVVGLVASFAVETVASMVLPWVGRKVAEFVVEKTGYVDKMSASTLGQGIMETLPEGFQHFSSVASSAVGQKWYDPKNSYGSYFKTMQRIATTDTGGISMRNFGMSTRDTGTLYDAVGKNLNINNANRGYYTRTLGTLKGITGQDFTSTFSGISQGVAVSKTVKAGEIDATAQAFQNYFDAISKGGKTINKSSTELVKSLAASADVYAQRNIAAKDVDVMFTGIQKFVQSEMQPEGKQDTSEAGDIAGIMNNVAKSYGQSPLASRIANYAGLSLSDAKRGLDADGFERMSKAFSGMYDFGGNSSVDKKTGTLKLDRKGENAFAQMYLDATNASEQGGMGLSQDDAMELIKYVVAYQNNPNALKFGSASKNPLTSAAKSMQMDVLLKHADTQVKITDVYESLTGTFADEFIELSGSILNYSAKMTKDIAQASLDLIAITKKLIDSAGDYTPNTPDSPGGAGGLAPLGYSAPTITAGRKMIESKDMLVAQAGFKEEIGGAAARAGLELKTLYAFLGAESRFGNNTLNYRGSDYVGVGQIGVAAMKHMNQLHNLNLDRNKRADNILLAALYADYLRDRYVRMKADKKSSLYGLNFDPNDPRIIYMAYNWGMGNLDAHIRKYGGINWDALPDETKIGVGNVEKAMRGYDASTGVAFQGPVMPTKGNVKGLINSVSNYNGGVIQGINGGSRRTSNAKLYAMSGASTTLGLKTADAAERLLATGGRELRGTAMAANSFYGWCAAIAGWALEKGGYKGRPTGSADEQLGQWLNSQALKGSVLTLAEVAQTGGFQPGDLVYVRGGNHVGIVSHDGSIIQAGFGKDENDSYLIRTDSTTFDYAGGAIVIRASADADANGVVTQAERNALFQFKKAVDTAKFKKVAKSIKGKEVTVNALVDKTSGGNFTVKNRNGTGLSKAQIGKIKAREAAIEKKLGLTADQLAFETKAGSGGTLLNIKIKAPLDDVGKVTQDVIKIIEGII